MPLYDSMILETINTLFGDAGQSSGQPSNNLTATKRDFQLLHSRMEGLQNRIERIVAVTTAVMSIEESRRALDQNRNLARLTYLAVIFIPMSFVSSLFSMTDDLSTLKATFWVYFTVAIPLSIIALGVADFLHLQKLCGRVTRRLTSIVKAKN